MNKLLFLCLIALCGCSSQVYRNGIPNFAVVEPGKVYRGGQPTPEGWKYLREIGVHNVIKLNEQSEGSDGLAWKNGMSVYYVPVSLPQQLGLEPMPKNFFLGYNSNVGGTFIHCEHGQDRTGLFVAMWRVKFDGCTKSEAEEEMLEYGFHKSLHGLWEAWEKFKP